MSKVIRITETTFSRLQQLAIPLVDTPASVIDKLLDIYDGLNHKYDNPEKKIEPQHFAPKINTDSFGAVTSTLTDREPRQRGVVLKIDGQKFKADSLPILYKQILRFLCDGGHIEQIRKNLPIATSAKRYLIATEPFHPNGKEFFVQVEYGGLYMEAHKSYKTGINHLKKLLDVCGISLTYVA